MVFEQCFLRRGTLVTMNLTISKWKKWKIILKLSIKNSQIDTYPTLPYATLLPLIIDQYSSLSIESSI